MAKYKDLLKYDCVEDYTECNKTETYDIFHVMGRRYKDEIFCTGSLCFVKNDNGIMKLLQGNLLWTNVYMTSSYVLAEYVLVEDFEFE